MARSPNARIAVELYDELDSLYQWDAANAWKGVAILLLTCEVWGVGWQSFKDCVVYRERNDFKDGAKGPSLVTKRAHLLSQYLADELGVSREALCDTIGKYFRDPRIRPLQPHNLVGHAFRSIVVHILQKHGDQGVSYAEEVNPSEEFPGHSFQTRSKEARVDIVARRGASTVALMSSRWRYRHDRVDMIDEAIAYAPPALRQNRNCKLYGMVGEFSVPRLVKVLEHCPPLHPNGAISALVHFNPQLLWNGLGENGKTSHLKSLEWLIGQTFEWK